MIIFCLKCYLLYCSPCCNKHLLFDFENISSKEQVKKMGKFARKVTSQALPGLVSWFSSFII